MKRLKNNPNAFGNNNAVNNRKLETAVKFKANQSNKAVGACLGTNVFSFPLAGTFPANILAENPVD